MAETDEGTASPLIPNPTTELDRRTNRAFTLAAESGERRYVWVAIDRPGEPVLIGRQRPHVDPAWDIVVVDPSGWAIRIPADGDEPP